MNLYRIMTQVRAGPHQRTVATGDVGIVTLWLRATSEDAALALARSVLTQKRYALVSDLHAYVEVLVNDPLPCSTENERAAERQDDWVLAGYDSMKERALLQADGLHEVWLGPPACQVAGESKIA